MQNHSKTSGNREIVENNANICVKKLLDSVACLITISKGRALLFYFPKDENVFRK